MVSPVKPSDDAGISELINNFLVPILNGAKGADYTALSTAIQNALYQRIVIVAFNAQSNWSGRGTNNQLYNGVAANALMLGNDYVMKRLADPTDSAFGQVDGVSRDDSAAGSVWPLVISRLERTVVNPKFILVPCAKGGSSITEWLPGANHLNRSTLYGSALYRARQAGAGQPGVLTVAIGWQGETDAKNGMTQATYQGHMSTIAAALMTDLGVKLYPAKFQTCTETATAAGQSAIWAAIGNRWINDPNVGQGPDLTVLTTDAADGLHLNSDMNLSRAADLWVPVIQAAAGLPIGLGVSDNRIRRSEAADQWSLVQVTVTPDSDPNPLTGAMTADRVTGSSASGTGKSINSPTFPVTLGEKIVGSFYAKAGTAQFVQLVCSSATVGTNWWGNIDLVNGTWGTTGSGVEVLSTPVAGQTGWFRYQLSGPVLVASGTAQMGISQVQSLTAGRAGQAPAASQDWVFYGGQLEGPRASAGPYTATA